MTDTPPREADARTTPAPATTAEASAPADAAAVGLFKQRKNRGNLRKRGADDDDAEQQGDETAVVRKAKQTRGDPLAFSTKRDSKEELAVSYAGNAALPSGRDDTATRSLETETQFDRDARAQREKVLRQGVEGVQVDGTYKGMTGYVDYRAGFRREHQVGAEKGSGSHGPLRGNVFVRTTARFDYQPDICKDYKETGFCSFGDSCKFMHDRGDYKSGWELEREWEAKQKQKQEAMLKGWGEEGEEGGGEEAGEGGEDDGLPFACYICREPWAEVKSDPVVTRCRHYFCESCALKHNTKTGKCAVCEQPTQGIFNVATDVLKKLKAKEGG